MKFLSEYSSFGVKGSITGFRLDCQLTKQLSATAITVYGYQPVLYTSLSHHLHLLLDLVN